MLKKSVMLPAVVLAVTLWSGEAFAVFGVGDVSTDPVADAYLAQQVSLMTESLAQQLKEVAGLGEIIANLTAMIRTANEIAAATRFAANVYNSLRHYSLDDLKRDALTGLYRTFPELAQMESEADLLMENGESIEKGPGAFFGMKDYRDQSIQRTIADVATAELKATTYSRIFPKSFAKSSAAGVTEADRLVLGRFLRTGQLGRVAVEAAASTVVRDRINTLVTEAEGSEQRDQLVNAMALEATTDAANNIRRMTDLQEADVAEVEAGHRAVELINQHAQGEVEKAISEGALSKPGWGKE